MTEAADRPSLPRPRARPRGAVPDGVADAVAERVRPRPRPEGLGETPPGTAALATAEGALDTGATALLGVFDGPAGASALLRLADGRILRVRPGDAVGPLRVAGIGARTLRLSGVATAVTLALPA